jgi:hypothetical protein
MVGLAAMPHRQVEPADTDDVAVVLPIDWLGSFCSTQIGTVGRQGKALLALVITDPCAFCNTQPGVAADSSEQW